MLQTKSPALPSEPESVELKLPDSAALRRIIEEVRNTGGATWAGPTAYNRTYHRHNR